LKKLFWLLLWLAACAPTEFATPTLTRSLSGPTLAPTQPVLVRPPTEGPPPLAGAIGMSDPTAASVPNQAVMPPRAIGTPGSRSIEITAADGTLLVGELYQPVAERLPGVLLLGTDTANWGVLPSELNNAGFTVLVMTLRPDGADVPVLLETLASGIADPARIGAVGAAAGADAVMNGCALVALCDAAVLLSPESADLNALGLFNPRPLMLAASEDDPAAYMNAQSLAEAATGTSLFQPFAAAGHGTAMLQRRPDLAGLIVEWFLSQLV
jgi:hypothetical protein